MATNDISQKFVLAKNVAIWQLDHTMNLQQEIKAWLKENPDKRPAHLARMANVPNSTISRLLNGKRKGVNYETADRLRRVMHDGGQAQV